MYNMFMVKIFFINNVSVTKYQAFDVFLVFAAIPIPNTSENTEMDKSPSSYVEHFYSIKRKHNTAV